jgi:hypothetical protein
VLAPLDVDQHLAFRPRDVKHVTVPVSPQVNGRARRIVAYPNDFLVRGVGKRHPRSVGVVPPEKVVSDHPAGRVKDRDRPDERERFIGLEV